MNSATIQYSTKATRTGDAAFRVIWNGSSVVGAFSRESAERAAAVINATPAGQEPDWTAVRAAL